MKTGKKAPIYMTRESFNLIIIYEESSDLTIKLFLEIILNMKISSNYHSNNLEKLYLAFGSNSLNSRNKEGATLLLYALEYSSSKCLLGDSDMDYLIEYSNINYFLNRADKPSSILLAALTGNRTLTHTQMDTILEKTNFKTIEDFCPLSWAFMFNRLLNLNHKQFEVLLKKSNVNKLADEKNALFYYFINKEHNNIHLTQEQVNYLIEKSNPIKAQIPHVRESNLLAYALMFNKKNKLNLTFYQFDLLYQQYSTSFLKYLNKETGGEEIIKAHQEYIKTKNIIEERLRLGEILPLDVKSNYPQKNNKI